MLSKTPRREQDEKRKIFVKFSISFSMLTIFLSITAHSGIQIDAQMIRKAHQYVISHNDLFFKMDKKYPGAADKFRFRILSYDELQRKYYGKDADNLTEVTAYYDPHSNTAYFHDQFDFSTLEGEAAFLHEYVHFLQYAYKLDEFVSCSHEIEYDAYRIQADYLVDHGMDKNSAFISNLSMSANVFMDCTTNL